MLEPALSERAPKAFRDGTHRSISPDDTIARVRCHGARMGITRLGNITGLDHIGIPVAIAVRPKSRSISVCQGKGLGLPQAFASALMEAAEFYHSEELEDRFLLASYRELAATACVVEPAALCGNGRRFDPARPIEWIEGYDLLRQEACWVPAEIVHTDATRAQTHDSGCFLRGSNGLASGNNLLEAMSSGICEVVERDAVALWTARDLRERAACHVDLRSIDDPAALELLSRYEQAGIGVRIWNVTSDVGIAGFVCHIREESDDPSLGMRRFHGAGCHPDRGIALTRALTEAAQTRLAYINGAREDLPFWHYAAPDNADVAEALLDALQAAREPRQFDEVPQFGSVDVGDDVRWELDRLRSIGIERAIAVDLTLAELAIPVVRMVIPGLEGDCRNAEYVPGERAHPAESRVRKVWRALKASSGIGKSSPGLARPSASWRGLGPPPEASPAMANGAEPFAIIFAGPSLPPAARPPDSRLVWRPPARQGDVYRAALEHPAAIGLIDGYFDAVPSVWHNEILWAMEQGIRVYGAASMGALRAAELAAFGMIGVGWIFEMYRDSTLVDDDEVAVLHGPGATSYIQVTEPIVNLRATMNEAVRTDAVAYDNAAIIIASAKCLHYKLRTVAAVFSEAAERGVTHETLCQLRSWMRDCWIDQKRFDSDRMIGAIQADGELYPAI
jgi:YcaO-like protein with predicted kinase domain